MQLYIELHLLFLTVHTLLSISARMMLVYKEVGDDICLDAVKRNPPFFSNLLWWFVGSVTLLSVSDGWSVGWFVVIY